MQLLSDEDEPCEVFFSMIQNFHQPFGCVLLALAFEITFLDMKRSIQGRTGPTTTTDASWKETGTARAAANTNQREKTRGSTADDGTWIVPSAAVQIETSNFKGVGLQLFFVKLFLMCLLGL